MSGVESASDGDAYIDGYSIQSETDEIRRRIGVCPQHDILLPFLSPSQHLFLFAIIKGVGVEKMQEKIKQTLTYVDLAHASCFTENSFAKLFFQLFLRLLTFPFTSLVEE